MATLQNAKKSEGEEYLRKQSHGVSMSLVSRRLTQEKEKYMVGDDNPIEWSNLIFLPFHRIFQIFVLVSVFLKAMLGPIQSVYPLIYCNDVMDYHPVLMFIKYIYWYFCDSIYGIDTFLHIVHRQVVDKAMRREHLPKSALLLLCDLLALIPFFRLVMTDPCPEARLWPNILAFNEFLVIYRVTDYFQLQSTHSYPKLLIGFAIVLAMCINCVGCFWLLLTNEGFCDDCTKDDVYYDWRGYVMFKINETDEGFATYIYSAVFVYSIVINNILDVMKPSALLEYRMTNFFLVGSYVFFLFVVLPKAFAESLLRFRRICKQYPIVQKIIADTKRRNPLADAHLQVEHYYEIIWSKRSCILDPPYEFLILPRYLRLDIRQDLLWPLFHHSPTLRKTSQSFRRWISESTNLIYKLPSEKFFMGQQSRGALYYLQTGIVQFISLDDGVTPILSCSTGTVFGDINFLVPHKRKVLVRCLTYCEIFYIKRKSLIEALHIYPIDRKIIMKDAKKRMNHAKALFANKQFIRGLDRNEDEGIAWIKRRWWEISNFFEVYTKKTGEAKETLREGDLPREETVYHCAKYIGQIVLCSPTDLLTQSMFTNFKFPWILNPQSSFGFAWHKIITANVMLVLCLYPQHLIQPQIPEWFNFFSHWSDTMYIVDLTVSLLTAVKKHDGVTQSFADVMFERFKTLAFIVDLLATVWIEDLAELMGSPRYYYTLQYNRLLKIYILFCGDYLKWDIKKNPAVDICRKLALLHFAFTFITGHAVFELIQYCPDLSMEYFFGEILCSKTVRVNCQPINDFVGVVIWWSFEWIFSESGPEKLMDVYVSIIIGFASFIIYTFSKARMISYMYLTHSQIIKYQDFVINLKSYYEHYRIHKDLLHRLDRYLLCHWKYYIGRDVLYNNNLVDDQPYEVYWKAQGAVAKRIIAECKVFTGADPEIAKELARVSKFLLMPKSSALYAFGTLCRNVIWVVQGYVKSEFYNEKGELVVAFHGPGNMLSIDGIMFQKPCLRNYTTYTDCEVVYMSTIQFFDIYKKYPVEFKYLENCVNEFESMRADIFKKHILKHRDFQTKLRDRIYSTRMSMVSSSKMIADIPDTRTLPVEGLIWGDPESRFMQTWMLFRTVTVALSIMSASFLGGVGASMRWTFMMTGAYFDCIGYIDILLKLCLPFYNEDGIYVTDKKKCLKNYLTKGFMLDIIGTLPWFAVLRILLNQNIDDDTCFLINTICKFAHLYILFAYFAYITDIPTISTTSIMILKWQIVNILLVGGAAHYLMVNCVHYKFNANGRILTGITLRNQCWMPQVFRLPHQLNKDDLNLIFGESLNMAECGLLRMNFGRFVIDRSDLGVGFILFGLGLTFWFITCYTLTLLILNNRGNTVFQHQVHQLQKFLKSERVEKNITENILVHFRYCWLRTKGINIQHLTNDCIGAVFRQDLNYYFYKKTFTLLDSILSGGEQIEKQLASVCDINYFLPGNDIIREMDISPDVFIVHRGKVNISKDGKKMIVLTKGDIFGQLQGSKLRAVRVTATTEDHVDLLSIKVKTFQNIITDEIRDTITYNRQAKNDFMATKNIFIENPFDTVLYLLRGRKTLLLPGRTTPSEARHGTWYARWLYLTWFVSPYVSAALVTYATVVPKDSPLWFSINCILWVTDVLTLLNIIAEFFTIELVVIGKRCVPRRYGLKKFKDAYFYVDIVSILIPPLFLISKRWELQMSRLIRLKFMRDYHVHFCRGFKSTLAPRILKFGIVTLALHFLTCGWIMIACRDDQFPIEIIDVRPLNTTIDFSQWSHPGDRKGGCARVTRDILDKDGNWYPSFVVPKYWRHDYVIALTYILLIHTHTSIDIVLPLTLKAVYFKVLTTCIMYLLDLWIASMAVNYVYTKYRDLYRYDYNVETMITYLSNAGLCQSLKDIVLEYTRQVWQRQKGDFLPEIAYQAPPCLRHDIFTALYIHHLEAAPTFRHLPDYFKRQLCSRFQRVIIFPGKCIVRAGDTFNTTYFIHQGEVEKWFIDSAGESQMMSVLYTNGYFGCIAGLITHVGYQFSYYSRTVVDLVYLSLENWEDLLRCYPEITSLLHNVTKQIKKDKNPYKTQSTSAMGADSS